MSQGSTVEPVSYIARPSLGCDAEIMLICARTLKSALDDALQAMDRPHVDLGPLLGLSIPVRVGVEDMHELLQSGEPALRIEVGPASVLARRQDGGMLAELSLQW